MNATDRTAVAKFRKLFCPVLLPSGLIPTVESTTDHDLLAEYRRGSEEAFARLVRRHIAWVHSIARRRVRDAHLAEDVTQAAFIVLSRKAARLRPGTVLPAWLFRVTTYAAAKAARAESRRVARETEAAMRRADVDQPDETNARGAGPVPF